MLILLRVAEGIGEDSRVVGQEKEANWILDEDYLIGSARFRHWTCVLVFIHAEYLDVYGLHIYGE